MISGVRLVPRQTFGDDTGTVMRMLRKTDEEFVDFGEVYVSSVNARQRKPWRRHREATSNLIVPSGSVRFVLFEEQSVPVNNLNVMEFELGVTNHQLLIVPPNIWFALVSTSDTTSLIVNCSNVVHQSTLVDRRAFSDTRMPNIG